IAPTDGALATGVNGAVVVTVAGVLNIQSSAPSKQLAISGIASRYHAIEHVDSVADSLKDVLRRAHAHQIPWLIPRHNRRDVRYDVEHGVFVFADRQPADAVTVESDLKKALEALVSQIQVNASLVYAEYCLTRINQS